jgi:hypothetical protein
MKFTGRATCARSIHLNDADRSGRAFAREGSAVEDEIVGESKRNFVAESMEEEWRWSGNRRSLR